MTRVLTEKAKAVLDRFAYHPVTRSSVGDFHKAVRDHAGALAVWFQEALPDVDGEQARLKALALTDLQSAAQWANAAIAIAQAELPGAGRRAPFVEVVETLEVPAVCTRAHTDDDPAVVAPVG